MRHASNAYQVHVQKTLQDDSLVSEFFEVFTHPGQIKVFDKAEYAENLMQIAQKDQYLVSRGVGDNFVKAVRLCNYSEWYNEGQNACLPCQSSF